ncbi:hypothetical protein Bca101_006639 [Brassica carinata]
MFPSSDASLTGFLMLFRSMLHDFVPVQLRSYFSGLLERFFTPKSKNLKVVIDEKFKNKVFHAVEMYLRKKIGPEIYFIIHSVALVVKHLTIKEKRSSIRSRTQGDTDAVLRGVVSFVEKMVLQKADTSKHATHIKQISITLTPPTFVPRAAEHSPYATIAAEPEEDPPVTCLTFSKITPQLRSLEATTESFYTKCSKVVPPIDEKSYDRLVVAKYKKQIAAALMISESEKLPSSNLCLEASACFLTSLASKEIKNGVVSLDLRIILRSEEDTSTSS